MAFYHDRDRRQYQAITVWLSGTLLLTAHCSLHSVAAVIEVKGGELAKERITSCLPLQTRRDYGLHPMMPEQLSDFDLMFVSFRNRLFR